MDVAAERVRASREFVSTDLAAPVVRAGGDELVAVRGLGGELKRAERRWPWWLLFLGI